MMKKVLMIASAASHFENFHIPYMEYLRSRGVQVYTASAGTLRSQYVYRHITLPYRKKLYHPLNFIVILRLARLIRKERFDAVYTNSSLAGFTGRMALKLSGRKNTKAVHICHGYLFDDDGSRRSRLYLAFEKILRRRTDLLAVMNEADRRIAEKYSLGKEIAFINGMGLDASRFTRIDGGRMQRLRRELGASEKTVVFLCVGEFSQRKNQQCIVEACALLGDKDYRMVFAGEGELQEKCKEIAKKLGIYDKTVFLGHRRDTNELYRSCDCLISASRFEGLPFNVMEALYCGMDILVSDVKGSRDLAEKYGGRLFPYGSRAELAAAMQDTRRRMQGDNASPEPRRSCGEFLLDSVFEENLKLLEML